MIEACFHDGVNIRLEGRDYDGGMATSIDQKNFVKTALRLPPDLHAAVHAAAEKSGRSYNAELVDRVQKSFEVDEAGQQAEMLLEMRRTQLHLELNSLKQELGHLFAEGKSIQAQLQGTPDAKAIRELEKSMNQISARKKDIDRRSAEVLSRLSELDTFHQGGKPKP